MSDTPPTTPVRPPGQVDGHALLLRVLTIAETAAASEDRADVAAMLAVAVALLVAMRPDLRPTTGVEG